MSFEKEKGEISDESVRVVCVADSVNDVSTVCPHRAGKPRLHRPLNERAPSWSGCDRRRRKQVIVRVMGSDHAVPEVPSAANSGTAASDTPAALCAPPARSLLAQGAWLNHNEEAWSRRPGAALHTAPFIGPGDNRARPRRLIPIGSPRVQRHLRVSARRVNTLNHRWE